MKNGFLILALVITTGCASTNPIHTATDFYRLSHTSGMGHFFYIGSEEETNFYATSYLLQKTSYYSYPQTNYPIAHRFPKSPDRNQWKPFLLNINQNTEGFAGEERKPWKTKTE